MSFYAVGGCSIRSMIMFVETQAFSCATAHSLRWTLALAATTSVPLGSSIWPTMNISYPAFSISTRIYGVDLFGEGRVDEYTVNPLLFLANGVTSTCFPAGEVDPEGNGMEARKRIDNGQQIGPRILNSGPYFGSARPGWNDAEMDAEHIRADVRKCAALGIKGLKAKGIHPDQLAALIDEGHRHGLTITGHLDSGYRNTVNPRDAIAMGIDRVEHFMGGDTLTADKPAYRSLEELDTTRLEAAIFRTYIAQHVYFDPTLNTYGTFSDRQPKELYEYWVDEREFLTPYARGVVESRLPRPKDEQFGRLFKAKLKE